MVVGSDSSSRMIFDKLPKKEIHGQVPQVTNANRQALSQFEAQSKKDGGPPQNGNYLIDRAYGVGLKSNLSSPLAQDQ